MSITERTGYECAECGARHATWAGQCATCSAWNSIVAAEPPAAAGAGAAAVRRSPPELLADVDPLDAVPRPTGIGELDRVLGGGLVPGAVTLFGGEPGIGKSTLVLQVAAGWSGPVLYIGGEESPQQVSQRAARLAAHGGGDASSTEQLWIAAETSLRGVVAAIDRVEPELVVIDSIQTIADERLAPSPGSPTQVRECAQALVAEAKRCSVPVLVVGHVTKDGAIAGPRALEHVVDTVLSFEGERHHALRLLRAVKHRFGSTNELGLFEMTDAGLSGVADPSALFLGDRRADVAGSAVVAAMEGQRPLLVEVQALTVQIPERANPRRNATGLDGNRLAMLLAVVERRAHVKTSDVDVYASTVGGIRLVEPGIDVGVALAIISAVLDRPLFADLVAVGEVGLAGELRQVSNGARRLAEAARLGYRRAIVPPGMPAVDGIEPIVVESLLEASVLAVAPPPRSP